MSLIDTLGDVGKGLLNFVSGGLGDKIVDTVKGFFPASMSEQEKLEMQLRIKDAAHKQEMELMQLLNESEKEFNKRTIALEGTAKDLKVIPFIGPIIIFLRGAFRPLTSYVVVYMDFMTLSGQWHVSDKLTILVLGFFFGERAMKNITPIIGQYFGNKNKELGND